MSINMQMQQFLLVSRGVRPEFIVPRTKFSVSLRLTRGAAVCSEGSSAHHRPWEE